MVFTEYERIQKKRLLDGECSIAHLPENAERNRFQDVLPYDDTRVELVPTKENNTGYINASHIKVRLEGRQMFQPNFLYFLFWTRNFAPELLLAWEGKSLVHLTVGGPNKCWSEECFSTCGPGLLQNMFF